MKTIAIIDTFSASAVIVLLSLAMSGCEHKADSPTEAQPVIAGDVITFPVSSVSLKNIITEKVAAPRDRELNISGRLVWDEDRTVRIFTPFAGRVSKVVANVGDRVTSGQVLAELQSPDFAIAQTDARRASTMLTLAKQALNRVKDLAANGVVAGKDLQQAQSDYANAEAEASRAEARLKLYGNSQTVDQRFRLISPIAGTVVERNLNPGQELRPDQPNAPQFVVTDPAKLWVQLDASESDLKLLKAGTRIIVASSQYPDDSFAGELKQIADFIDPVSRSVKLRGIVPNADRRLKAEMFVNAHIAIAKSEFPTVPEKAVFLEGIRQFVFVKIAPEKFARRGVNVALEALQSPSNTVNVSSTTSMQRSLRVTSGLKEGDEVVVSGNLLMQQMLASVLTVPASTTTPAPTRMPSATPEAPMPVTTKVQPKFNTVAPAKP